ncbi:MAG: heparan-alpha-glucosaminide N-acetyltransferase domain-containing protein [Gemmatimonadales bacterium]
MSDARERYVALDLARGLAVVGMIYMHLVPTEGSASFAGHAWTAAARLLEGKSAALFCLLAGMAWQIQAERSSGSPYYRGYVLRRALALALAGAVFHALVWPTEILLPLALMMVLALWVRRAGPRATAALAVLLVAFAPLVPALLNGRIAADWGPDGTPLADSAPGWATVRYFLLDGSYPVVPWMAFPLVGMLMLGGGLPQLARARRWFWIALAVAIPAQIWVRWAGGHEDSLGELAPFLLGTWVPTSVPFVLVAGGTAAAVVAGLVWLYRARKLLTFVLPLAMFGRASLTHYILHICVVIVPLRLAWPEEDWPIRVGALAFAAYVAVALPLTVLWFRGRSHGPLEGAWATVSGRAR